VIGTHRIAEFGFPGELRDRLASAILRRAKTATTRFRLVRVLNALTSARPG
jgi:hypothetical protein